MIPVPFDYVRPTTVEEAVQALVEGGNDAKLLAGGQSLLPVLRLRMGDPSLVIDLGGVPELRGVRDDGDAIVVGAMTTHHDVTRDELLAQHVALVPAATRTVADPQVRHRGTLGGALAHADPAGDMAAPTLALDAELVVNGPQGERRVAASDFFEDYFTTAIGPQEILTAIRYPKYTGWGARYEKFNRVAQAWSIVAVAATVKVDAGTISDVRIGLTNMAGTPVRARAVESALVGRAMSEDTVRAAAAAAAEGTSPTSDVDAGSDYREHLSRVLTGRAVLAAAR